MNTYIVEYISDGDAVADFRINSQTLSGALSQVIDDLRKIDNKTYDGVEITGVAIIKFG